MDHKQARAPDPPGSPRHWSEEVWTFDVADRDGTPTATLQAVYECLDCPEFLRRTLAGPFTWQNRNRRDVQRALISPGIAPQWSAALLAAGAMVTLDDESGSAEVPLESLLDRTVSGKPVAVHVRTDIQWGEAHVARAPADEPIVSATAGVLLKDGLVREARVALTGAWPKPVGLAAAAGALAGQPLTAERIKAVAEAIGKEVEPVADFRGSEEYRRAMAGVLARRALEQCLDAPTAGAGPQESQNE